ncbi:unnamed protein product [Paramecium octaurelia]|uniref:Uncharacterized protein n=1 Tax=Paramecium octaurelia TaxID=43137 RepID=A0A8S1UT97_PAROT|nr:unnamed protein product [Paramecium octaurelia]
MRGQNQPYYQICSPQRAPQRLQVVSQQPSQNDKMINLKCEKVLMGFEIQRQNQIIKELEENKNQLEQQIKTYKDEQKILLLEISTLNQEINKAQEQEKKYREQLNSYIRNQPQMDNQMQIDLSGEYEKLKEENQYLESKISYLLSINQLENKQDISSIKKLNLDQSEAQNHTPSNIHKLLEQLQNNIQNYKQGNSIQTKYLNSITILKELIKSQISFLAKQDNLNKEIDYQQIEIYLTKINQDIEELKAYETPKAVRRILNNQSPQLGRSCSQGLSSEEVFSKIIGHIEYLQQGGLSIPTILKQISLLNSLVRLKNDDLKLISNNNKLKQSPTRFSIALTPVKYLSPIRISPLKIHPFVMNMSAPQKVSIIQSNIHDSHQTNQRQNVIDSFPIQQRDEFQNVLNSFRDNQDKINQLEFEKIQLQEQAKLLRQKYDQLIENQIYQPQDQNLSQLESLDAENLILKRQNIDLKQQKQPEDYKKQIVQQKELIHNLENEKLIKNDELITLFEEKDIESADELQEDKLKQMNILQTENIILKDQIQEVEQQRQEDLKSFKQIIGEGADQQCIADLVTQKQKLQTDQRQQLIQINKLQQELILQQNENNDLKEMMNQLKRQKQDKNLKEENEVFSKRENEIDELRKEQIKLKDELIQTKQQLNEQMQQQIQKPQGSEKQIQFQTDPEKVLQISSLQAECVNLKKQIQDVEQQRKDDLKSFENMLGEGVNESQIIGLTSDKQQLQSELRILQNKCDQLQQEQIALQNQLLQKNKQIVDLQDDTKLSEKEQQIREKDNEIKLLEQQIQTAKDQYQELLDLQQQNLTPGGQKEKILQQTKEIHDQQEVINELQHKVETEVPQLQQLLCEAEEKFKEAQSQADLWNKNYKDLQEAKQQQVDDFVKPEQIENYSLDQAKDALKKLNDELKKQQQINNEQLQVNENLQKQMKDPQEMASQNQNEIDELKKEQIKLKDELIQTKQQLNEQLQQQIQKPQGSEKQIQFQTDPEKVLQISQLQAECVNLKKQIQDVEQQRKDDLKSFEKMLGEGVNESQIIGLTSDKQQLQSDLRILQNKCDQLQQEQIALQNQLLQKNKQIVDLQDDTKQSQKEEQIREKDNEIKLLEQQIQTAKDQYQELLDLQQQNLTPGGQKEKILQQTKEIHDQQEVINELEQKVETEVPQLQQLLCEAEEKFKEAQSQADLWNKNYKDLQEAKQQQVDDFVKPEQIENYSLDQAKDALKKLNDELKKQQQINNEQLQVNENLQKQMKDPQEMASQNQNEIDELKKEQIKLKDELIQTKQQLNEQLQQQIQKPQGSEKQIQFQTDPEKVLQISQLQAECVNLKKQIQDVEQQRKDDLKSFEKMLGEGVNESQIISLTTDKQQLQSDLRQLQNKCDQLQQEQIALQNQLLQKNKQIVDLQDDTKQSQKEEQIREKDNEIKLLEQQIQTAKDQYQELLDLQQQNLTPGGQKEKILQQTKEIHDQQEVINELQHKVETEIPQLQQLLCEAEEKFKEAQSQADLWNKNYKDLQEAKQQQVDDFVKPEQIENYSLDQAKDALKKLNDELKKQQQINNEQLQVNENLQNQMKDPQEMASQNQNEIDELKKEQIKLKDELIQTKQYLNEQLQQQIQKPQGSEKQIQFQTDPEKVLQISQLQAECVNLKKQIQDVEQQRKDDLKSFEKMIGEGVNESQIISLTTDKQQLQSDLRLLQNQCDKLQQEQIALQDQLLQKNKQIVDLQDDTKYSEKEEQIREKDNEIKLLEQQIQTAKDQYQELLDLQQQNLTPGGQKEKILQQTKEIHDQQEVINELQHKVETEIPQLQQLLCEAEEKFKEAQSQADLWNKNYKDLQEAKQQQVDDFVKPEQIENYSLDQAKDALKKLNDELKKQQQINNEQLQVNENLQNQMKDPQEMASQNQNEIDELKKEQIKLKDELIQTKQYLNEQLQQQIQKPQGSEKQIQFQTDPEKVLQISQLQAECVNLKKQIQDVEQQRKDDLKSFEKMIGEGVNESQIISLTTDKQQLQSDLRLLQNQCDKLQQEQIALQDQLLQKNKQIVDLQDDTKYSEKEEQIREKDNEIKLLEQQIQTAKDQYQELLDLQQQNLTPGGQKEKILQQTKEIHDQQEVINELEQKVETEVPQLQGQLSEAQEKLKDAQKDAELWNKKYHELLESKQTQVQNILAPEEIEKLSSEEAKNALTQLNKQYSDKAQENRELEMVVQHLRQDLDTSQEKVQQQAKEAQQEKAVHEQQTQILNSQLKDLVVKDEAQRKEILDLKNKVDQENADFWKQQYQQLAKKQPEISSTQVGDQQEQQVAQQEGEVKPKEVLNEEVELLKIKLEKLNDLQKENEELKAQQIIIQDELLQTKQQLNEQLQQQIQKPQGSEKQIQFQTDPEKVLQISQLQAECVNLKKQIQDVEQQRKDDLKSFEKMLGEGVNESQIISLTSDKQQLQSDLRQLQNKCDQLQQEQIALQNQLLQKNKQIVDLQDDTKQSEKEEQIREKDNEIKLLEQQIQTAKDQYQELLDLQQQNLTPGGQKEKILQQTKEIHDQQEVINELEQKVETEVPQLQGQLSEAQEKLKDAQKDAELWNKKYHELLESKQTQVQNILAPEEIEKLSSEEAKNALTQLNKQYSDKAQENKELEQLSKEQQSYLFQKQQELDQLQLKLDQVTQISNIQKLQLQSTADDYTNQIDQLKQYISDLKSQIDQQNPAFWKQSYQKLLEDTKQLNQNIPQDVFQQETVILPNQPAQTPLSEYQLLKQQYEELYQVKLQLQQELLLAQNRITQLINEQIIKPAGQEEAIQFSTDPQKALVVSQLEQTIQLLTQQISEIEKQRNDDLQKFKDMIGNGVNESTVATLMQEKQSLQSQLIKFKTQIDQNQQEQISIQNQLISKTNQLIELQESLKQDFSQQNIKQLQDENNLLQLELQKAKKSYQELLELQSENLTPNGLKEKILNQQKQIHDLEEQHLISQQKYENELSSLVGQLSEAKQKLKDSLADSELWNNKYHELLECRQNLPTLEIEDLQKKLLVSQQNTEKEREKYNNLLQEQYSQLSPTSSQAKLLQAQDQINQLKLQLENNKSQEIYSEPQQQIDSLQEEIENLRKNIENLEKINQISNEQIEYLKGQLQKNEINQPTQQIVTDSQELLQMQEQNIVYQSQINDQQKELQKAQNLIQQQQDKILDALKDQQKVEFWKKQYTDLLSEKYPQEQSNQIQELKEQQVSELPLIQENKQIQQLENQINQLQQDKVNLSQQLIDIQNKFNAAMQPKQQQESISTRQNDHIQSLENQIKELQKENKDVIVQMREALNGNDQQKQIADLLEINSSLKLNNSKLLIDLQMNQSELIRQQQQVQILNNTVNDLQDPTVAENTKLRVSDLEKQIDLIGQQVDFWKQKYQQVLNEYSQQLSPTSVQNKMLEQTKLIHDQEEALMLLQKTKDQSKLESDLEINNLKLQIKDIQEENLVLKKKLQDYQNQTQQLSIQRVISQGENELQVQYWKDKYQEALEALYKDPEHVQEILKQKEEVAQTLYFDKDSQSIHDFESDLIEKLRSENQTFQGEVTFYKKRVYELEQQQKIEPSQQDTVQSRQYQISQLEKDLQKAISNCAYWEQKYNEIAQQSIKIETQKYGGDPTQTATFWRQKYDQVELNRQQLIQVIAEKEEQLELNMQSFQQILKDELKEELTKIRTQEREKMEQQFQQNYPQSESVLIQKLKDSHEVEKEQLIQEFLRRIDQLLQSNVQKYPEGENWKELILRYEKQRQNELYELRQHLEILQRSQISTKDIEFYAERRAYENTINELRARISQEDPQELYDTIEYQRKVILDYENQISFLQNERTNLEMHIMQLNQQIDQLRDNISKFQIQQDHRKRQRAEVLEAIEEMKRERAADRDSFKSPYRQMRQSQRRTSWDRYPKDFLRPSNIQQPSPYQHQSSPMQKIPFQQSQFISPKQENREISLKLQELDEVKYKYQSALNNILQLETQVIEKLQQDDLQIE